MGGPDPLVTAGAGTSIAFGSSNVSLSQSNADDVIFLTADVSAPVAGRLELRTGGSYGLCSADSVGSYQWTLSSSARVLTLSAVDDACPQRSGAMAGTWWLVGCKDPGDNCLGDLEAGTYSSQFINFAKPTVPAWVADFGAVTYTVPDGWANDADWPARLGLSPKDSYANWTPNVGTDRGIDVLADVHVSSNEARPCSGSPLASAGSDPGRIVGSIRGIRGLQATAPSPVTIDGRPGVQVDLSVDDQKLVPCGSDRVVEFLVSGGEGMAIGPGERIRLIVLSDGERAIAIQILAPASAFDAVVAQSMPIVQSMHFK
jgi:hypothetical protein